MQHHEWISKTCWVKETLDKRVHTVWLHLYEVLKQAQLICGKKKWEHNGRGGQLTGKGCEGTFRMMIKFYILIGIWITQVYAFLKLIKQYYLMHAFYFG